MAKKQNTKANGLPLATVIRASANQIWLAGLGALAQAEDKGGDWFDNLTAAGEKFEKAARAQIARPFREAERRVNETRDSLGDSWAAVAVVVERRLAKLLNLLQIPTSRDVAELTRRVEELQQALQVLEKGDVKARSARKRPARAAKAAAKKKPTRTKSGKGSSADRSRATTGRARKTDATRHGQAGV